MAVWRARTLINCAGAILFAGAVATGCGREARPAPPPLIAVTVRAVAPSQMHGNAHYSANIEPNTQVSLSFQASGYVEQVTQVRGANGKQRSIQSGDVVTKGELLAVIHPDLYRQQLDNAQAQLEGVVAQEVHSKADFERYQKLIKQAVVSQSDYDAALKKLQAAEAQRKSARAALEQARINLGYCKLYSPMDGLILARNIEPGAQAGPSFVAFKLADTYEVKAVFGVSDAVVKDLNMGEPLSIETQAYPNQAFPGTITRIAPNADPTTRVFDVEVTIPNANGRLKTGMVASLRLDRSLDVADAPTVPLNSIVKLPGEPDRFAVYVVQKDGGKDIARLRDVQLGEIVGNEVAIDAGAQSGDLVIVRGANVVSDGAQVRVIVR